MVFTGVRVGSALLACALAGASIGARAQDATFGQQGQKVVFGHIGLDFDFGESRYEDQGLETDITVSFAPGVLYFVARDVAVGLDLHAAYADNAMAPSPYTAGELAVRAGFGVSFPLSAQLFLFPQLWAGAGYFWRETTVYVTSSFQDPALPPGTGLDFVVDGFLASFELMVPLQFQLGGAVYLGVGPSARVQVPFEDGELSSRVGLTAGLGGSF